MKKSSIVILAVVAIVIIIIAMFASSYNSIVAKAEEVDNKFATIDTQLQRRADLVPNLVNTVKGYTNHETEIINKITEARAKLINADSIEEKSNANNELTSSLNALMVVVENYPDLKSSENFIQLSDELAGAENRIAVARKDYNNSVKTWNTTIKRFPNNLLAGMFGFDQSEYFKADEKSIEVPNVSLE